MAKGAAIKFVSYAQSVPKLLSLLKLENELAKHKKIVLKVNLSRAYAGAEEADTPTAFLEEVVRFCVNNKNASTELIIAEGSDGAETEELFAEKGYTTLAEKYGVSLLDLNTADSEEMFSREFRAADSYFFPTTLKNAIIISLPKLAEDPSAELSGGLSIMRGTLPGSEYRGFFSKLKKGANKLPVADLIHDLTRCKAPSLTIFDASAQGYILAGVPLEMDKQAAKLIGRDWTTIPYLKLLDERGTSPQLPKSLESREQ